MKKFYALLVALVLVLSLTSCSKVSQKYADKVNKAAEAGECYTLTQVKEDLGDEAIEIIVPVINTGVVIAVKGCESYDEIKAKLDEGKETKGIIIVIAGGEAKSAEYRVITEEDLKK
jgi:hypothetical protein